MGWSRFDGDGPPSAATLAAESTASQPPLYPAVSWDELNRARFICWLCTSQRGQGTIVATGLVRRRQGSDH
jgi:hypothetical protein